MFPANPVLRSKSLKFVSVCKLSRIKRVFIFARMLCVELVALSENLLVFADLLLKGYFHLGSI